MKRERRSHTKVVGLRLPDAAVDGIDELRAVERRTRANMLTVIIERYLLCPACQERAKEKP
jgi:hypothetical protein